ncbi:hypothetical protein B0H13DRAFT_169459 [Mycena leptocephala]|nr:hypothetical protein B0H13DRAFT_169459 [Mycena leptocephala]
MNAQQAFVNCPRLSRYAPPSTRWSTMESLYRLPSKLLDELRVSSRVYPCPSMINGADWIPPRTSTTMLIIRKVETVIASRPKSVRNYLSPQVSITCYRRTQSVRRSHWSFAVPSPRLGSCISRYPSVKAAFVSSVSSLSSIRRPNRIAIV